MLLPMLDFACQDWPIFSHRIALGQMVTQPGRVRLHDEHERVRHAASCCSLASVEVLRCACLVDGCLWLLKVYQLVVPMRLRPTARASTGASHPMDSGSCANTGVMGWYTVSNILDTISGFSLR